MNIIASFQDNPVLNSILMAAALIVVIIAISLNRDIIPRAPDSFFYGGEDE